MRNFLAQSFIGLLLAGCMLGLLLSGDTLVGAVEGLLLGFGIWLTMLGWAFLRVNSG